MPCIDCPIDTLAGEDQESWQRASLILPTCVVRGRGEVSCPPKVKVRRSRNGALVRSLGHRWAIPYTSCHSSDSPCGRASGYTGVQDTVCNLACETHRPWEASRQYVSGQCGHTSVAAGGSIRLHCTLSTNNLCLRV